MSEMNGSATRASTTRFLPSKNIAENEKKTKREWIAYLLLPFPPNTKSRGLFKSRLNMRPRVRERTESASSKPSAKSLRLLLLYMPPMCPLPPEPPLPARIFLQRLHEVRTLEIRPQLLG